MPTLNNPALFQPSAAQENKTVKNMLHTKTASALRQYNEAIKWVQNQLEKGHIDTFLLRELITTIMPATHKTPIDIELSKLYIDPKFASIMADEKINTPSAMVHLAAKYLTLKKIYKTDFPPICNSELSETAISFN